MGAKIGTFAAPVATKSRMIESDLSYRLLGTVAGAAFALIFVPPHTWSTFARRAAGSLITGPIFAGELRGEFFGPGGDGLVAGAFVAAFIGWPVAGAVLRILGGSWLDDAVRRVLKPKE